MYFFLFKSSLKTFFSFIQLLLISMTIRNSKQTLHQDESTPFFSRRIKTLIFSAMWQWMRYWCIPGCYNFWWWVVTVVFVTIKIFRQRDVVDIVNIVFDTTDIVIIGIAWAVYCCIVNTMERLRNGVIWRWLKSNLIII